MSKLDQIEKLSKILKAQYPDWSEDKIFDTANQFLKFGFFIVNHWFKNNKIKQKTTFPTDFPEKTENPPISKTPT